MLTITKNLCSLKTLLGFQHPLIQSLFQWMSTDYSEEDPDLFASVVEHAKAAQSDPDLADLCALYVKANLVADLVDDEDWLAFIDQDVLDCPLSSAVGCTCMAIIAQADLLLSMLADTRHNGLADGVRAAAAHQTAVCLNG